MHRSRSWACARVEVAAQGSGSQVLQHVADGGGGDADVGLWREREQVVARFGRERQAADELVKDLFRERLAAREIFQSFVSVGQAVLAHHDLHGLAEDFPDTSQVTL